MRLLQARLPALRQRSPQHEYFGSSIGGKSTEQQRRQRFPAFARVRTGRTKFNRKDNVEKQYTLPCPVFERAIDRRRTAKVALQLGEDIAQTRRHAHPPRLQKMPGRAPVPPRDKDPDQESRRELRQTA